ncbi:hypothetical protein K0M31_008418, partial [Melipona bicolor]
IPATPKRNLDFTIQIKAPTENSIVSEPYLETARKRIERKTANILVRSRNPEIPLGSKHHQDSQYV